MAEEREIRRLIERVNITIAQEDVIQAMNQNKIGFIQNANSIEEFLLKNAEMIDMKKLLMVTVEKLGELTEQYNSISRKLAENTQKEWRKAIQLAKVYIKPEEEIKLLHIYQEDNIGRIKIENSKQIIYGKKEKNRHLRYDEIKGVIPQVEKQDIMEVYHAYKQMIGEEYIAKMTYATILENTLLQQGYTEEQIRKQYTEGISVEKVNELIEKMAQAAQADSFNRNFRQALEEIKGSIDADKYLLFHIRRIHQKLEKHQQLKEDEEKFLENIEILLEKSKDKTKFKITEEETYGKEEVNRFLARVNLKAKEYYTEEQLETGEKLLEDTNGYEKYLKASQIRELAKYEKNLVYLWQKGKITSTEIANLLKTIDVSTDTIINLYDKGAISQEQLEKLGLGKVEEIAKLYQEIYREGKEDKRETYENLIKIYNLKKKEDEEIITLLEEDLSDEMLINLYQDGLISIDLLESYGEKELVMKVLSQGKIKSADISKVIELYLQDKIKLKDLEKLEDGIEEFLTQEELIRQYKEAKKSNQFMKYKKYKLLYQSRREEKMDEKVLAEKEFIKEDIIQFYKDNLLTIEAILTYGGKELVQKLAVEGALKPSDAKEIFQKKEEQLKIEELLENPDMEDIQKMMLIYSTYDEDKEKRDYLVNYLQAHASEQRGESTTKEKGESDGKNSETRRTITDPYERWKLFSMLDKDYTKTYVDGYLVIHLNNSQTTIIEKMYQKKKGKIVPAYGTATFVLDTETYLEVEDKIIKKERLDIATVRKMARETPDRITKITHSPNKRKDEKNGWGERVLSVIGEEKIEEIYTEEDMQQIDECLRDIEASRENWER